MSILHVECVVNVFFSYSAKKYIIIRCSNCLETTFFLVFISIVPELCEVFVRYRCM